MKVLFAILAFALCAAVAAQQMFKCRDAAGRITYSGRECKDIGLSSAGEVKGQVNVMETPANTVPTPRREARQEAPDARDAPAAEAAPAAPEKRCFTVKTAKGTATRCNDKPDE